MRVLQSSFEPMPPIEQVPANQINSLLERNVERFTLGELPHLTPSGYIDPNSVEPIIQLGSAKQASPGHTQTTSLAQAAEKKLEQQYLRTELSKGLFQAKPYSRDLDRPKEAPLAEKFYLQQEGRSAKVSGALQNLPGFQEALAAQESLRVLENQRQPSPNQPRIMQQSFRVGPGLTTGSGVTTGSAGSLGIQRAFGQTMRKASSSQVISPEAAVLATGGALLAQQALAQQLAAPQQPGQQAPLGLAQEAQQVEQDLRKLREQEQQLAQAELASLMQSKTSSGHGDNQVAALQEKKLSNLASRLHGDLDQNQIHVVEHEVESFFDQLKEEAYDRFIENTAEAIHALIFGDEHKKERKVTDQELRDMCNAAYQITVARGKKSSSTSGFVMTPRQTGSMLIRPQKR